MTAAQRKQIAQLAERIYIANLAKHDFIKFEFNQFGPDLEIICFQSWEAARVFHEFTNDKNLSPIDE